MFEIFFFKYFFSTGPSASLYIKTRPSYIYMLSIAGQTAGPNGVAGGCLRLIKILPEINVYLRQKIVT